MIKTKFRKGILIALSSLMLISSFSVNTSAKTLKESFHGYSYMDWMEIFDKYQNEYRRKVSVAETNGYYKKHYVRAYLNKTDSTKNAEGDTFRKWSYGNIHVQAYSHKSAEFWHQFPHAYAKYGNQP